MATGMFQSYFMYTLSLSLSAAIHRPLAVVDRQALSFVEHSNSVDLYLHIRITSLLIEIAVEKRARFQRTSQPKIGILARFHHFLFSEPDPNGLLLEIWAISGGGGGALY